MFILKIVKVLCFDTLLQVFILNAVRGFRRRAWAVRVPPPGCICVNAVDKGVSKRFGVKALDKGLSMQRVDSGQWVVLSAVALRDWLRELADCENRSSGEEKEGRDGDTVSEPESHITAQVTICQVRN